LCPEKRVPSKVLSLITNGIGDWRINVVVASVPNIKKLLN